MEERKLPNQERPFDNNINIELGYHVYALFDPENGEIFYVGKAGGKEGRGNARVLSHFEEARNRDVNAENSAKIRKIHEIWRRGQDVEWKILRSGLASESEAFTVEAALIDTLEACGHKLLNSQGGHHSNRRGVSTRADVYVLAAPKVVVANIPSGLRERPIFIFNIQNAINKMWKELGKPDYLAATRRAWNVAPKWRRMENAIAIGLVDGISRVAFEIDEWKPDDILPNRYEILPKPLPEELEAELRERNFAEILEPCKGYMQFGNYPIIKFPANGDTIVFLRGMGRNKVSE